MGLFKNLKGMKDAMAAGMRGEGPSEEALASLTPEQRAAYDAQMARVAEAQQESLAGARAMEEAHAASVAARPLRGPAGEWLYGSEAAAGLSPDQMAAMSPAEMLAWSKANAKAQFADVLANPFGRRSAPPAPPVAPGADRAGEARAEREARDAARAPYLAPERLPVTFTRLAARQGSEIEELVAHLGASGIAHRPDLVWGAYRVPDAIGLGNLGLSRSKVVEWDIVHVPDPALAAAGPAPEPETVHLAGADRWVARPMGQRSLLDEDLAIGYLSAAGIGSEQTFGVARTLRLRTYGGGEDQSSITFHEVTGVQVLHASGLGAGARARFEASRPFDLPLDGIPGVRVEVLNWGAVADAVHPARHKAAPVPSPFPYLPSTPQELLRAYLDIVGVHPAHAYSAQVTEDEPRSIDGTGTKAGFQFTTNVGEEQPCADGTMRRRLTGGSLVVLAYRDAPAYAEGRERWDAYERDVLQSNLRSGTGARRPVPEPELESIPGPLRGLVKTIEAASDFWDGGNDPFRDIAPVRYCWPPSERA